MDYCDIFEITDGLTILYVEDDSSVALETAIWLNDFFSLVTVCSDGEDGLIAYKDYYQQNAKHYDIVLTDINMPILNGLDMSKKIFDICPSQVVVIVTAIYDPCYEQEIKSLGITHVLRKPTRVKEVMATLCSAATFTIECNKVSTT